MSYRDLRTSFCYRRTHAVLAAKEEMELNIQSTDTDAYENAALRLPLEWSTSSYSNSYY